MPLFQHVAPGMPPKGQPRQKRYAGSLVLAFALLCGISSAWAAPQETRLEARVVLTYPTGFSTHSIESISRAMARLDVLEKASPLVASHTAVRLSQPDNETLLALTSALVLPVIRVDEPQKTEQGTRALNASAQLLIRQKDLASAVPVALRREDDLDLRRRMLALTRNTLAEAQQLLAQSLEQPDKDIRPSAQRMEHLGSRLQALEQYAFVLTYYGSALQPADQAETALRKALDLDGENYLVWLALAESLLVQDRSHEALEAADRAKSLNGHFGRTYYIRGLIHLRMHLAALAVSDFSTALTFEPEKAAWWRARGAARLINNDFEAMCGDFYKACALGNCEGLEEVRKNKHCLAASPALP